MASQFDQAKVVLQPTQLTEPAQTNVFEQGAQVAGQLGAAAQQDAAQQGSRSQQLYASAIQTATVGFDRVLSEYNKLAEQNAIEEAPKIVQRDGNQQIIPPSSFYPSGLHSMAYSQAYRRTAIQIYRESAANDFANYSAEMKARHPNDLPAYQAAMDEKRKFMLNGLAEDQRAYMDLRFQGIAGQAGSQISVNAQAAANDVKLRSYNDQMTGISNDAVRYSGIYSGPGATPAPAPGMIPSVLQGLPPSVQARVTSTDRTPEQNAAVGGAPDSRHLRPNSAADIGTKGMPEAERLQLISSLMQNPNVRGLGFYGDHIHVDTDRDQRVVWGTPPAELKDHVDRWKAMPSPGGGMSGTDVAGDVARMRAWLGSSDPNAVMLRDRMIGANATGTQAGVPQVKHEQLLDDMALKAVIGAKANQIKGLIFKPGADGIIDQAQIAQEREKIRAYAATSPQFKDQIEQSLNQALDYKIQQSNAMAQSHQLASQRAGDSQIRGFAIRAREAELNTDPIAQAEAKRQLQLDSLAVLQDRNLSDSQAMRVAGAATQASGVARAALEESNNKRIQGLVSTIQSQDPMVGPDKKEAARLELVTAMNDPTIHKDLTVSQRAYAQGALNKVVEQQVGNDFVSAARAVAVGAWGPDEARSYVNRGIKEGLIGPHGVVPLDQALKLEALAKTTYDANQAESRTAASGLQRQAAGLATSPEEREAIARRLPFRLASEPSSFDPFGAPTGGGAKQRFDPTNTDDVQRYADYKRMTGITPDIVKRSVEEMNRSPDQDKMQGLLDLYRIEYDLAGERLRKANRGVEPTVAQLQAEVGHALGDNAKYLALALNTNAETAFKVWQAAVASPSVTGAQGQPNQPATQSMAQALESLAGEIQSTAAGSTTWGKLTSGRIPFTSGWNDNPKEKAVNEIFSRSPQSSAPGTVGQLVPALAGKSYEKVLYDDDVKDRLVTLSLLEQTRAGKINQYMSPGQDGSATAARQVLTNMFNDGLIELVPDEDGKNGRIKFRTFQSTMGARAGVPDLSAKSAQDIANQMIYADARPTAANPSGKMLPRFDPSTTKVFAVTEVDGSRYWHFGALEAGTGQKLDLGRFSQSDPRFSAATMAVQKTAAAQLYDVWTEIGPDGKLKKPDSGSLLGWGMAVQEFLSAPLQSYINKSRTEAALQPGTAANTYFAEELDRNLRELERRSTGMSGAPDWRATLRRAAETDTPLSGIPQDVLRAWAKQNPAGQEPKRLQ